MPAGLIFVTPFITILLQKLTSPEFLNFLAREGIDAEIKKWTKTLIKIQAVLSDAEEKQITDQHVKLWLDDLQDLAYDLDDVLDDFSTEALRCKLMAEPQASTSKVWKLIPTCFTSFTPRAMKFGYTMRSKLEEITSRFERISQHKNDLNLNEIPARLGLKTVRLPTTCLIESHVYGRKEDKEAILARLLMSEASDGRLCVIPIRGMGGVGKTTLAQLVYNDDKVTDCFKMKAWACVSDDFDIFRVTKTILESFTRKSYDFKDLNMLQVELKEQLSGRKFLLVLDDLWNENYEEWDVLRRPLLAGAHGSRIIVTTRHEKVASVTGSLQGSTYLLKELSNDDCLSLFARHALERNNFDAHAYLKEMGEEIVKRCKGLPLAAKTLGGLLRNKPHQTEWEDILDSKIWELPEQTTILPALQLSYHYLPSNLKRCFVYCSIFPKDYEFDRNVLVLLWMAEGFLQRSEEKKQIEDFDYGKKCFNELLSRSLFQRSSNNTSRYVMHDLINDLAQYVAGKLCSRLENDGQYRVSERACHSSFICQEYEVFQKFMPFYKVRRLRTFLALHVRKLESWDRNYLTNKVLIDLLPKLRCLRVLSLSHYFISELPDSIGNLKHLRYLDLSNTGIKWLPESVSTLYNLQILSLRSCRFLCKLPSSIGNLINLHHLDIADTDQLQEMPSGICNLTSLQTLPKIVVSSSGLKLRDLRDLSLLSGTLSIMGLQNVMDISDAKEANLKSKQLDELIIEWSGNVEDCQNEDLLDALRPHGSLLSLEIKFYLGIKFPSWVGDRSFCHIVNLSLNDCGKCTSLPTLGHLPLLKYLVIQGMHGVKRVGEEFWKLSDGHSLEIPFPSLNTLQFEDMPEWEDWFYFGSVMPFPCLRELVICKCPKLNHVSVLRLPSLCVLLLEECTQIVLKSFEDHLSSVAELRIKSISDLTCLWPSGVQLENLVRLEVSRCSKLASLFGEEEKVLLKNLEVLRIEDCNNLEKLPNVFSMLRRLEIRSCRALESIPAAMSHLEDITIYGCTNLKGWSLSTTTKTTWGNNLPTKLKKLTILGCGNGQSVSDITRMMLQGSTASLENVHIEGCEWPNRGSVHYTFASLTRLDIVNCHRMESFPLRGFSTPNLRYLTLLNCANLNSLSDQFHFLTSLTHLRICDCPSLDPFPQGYFPPNLTDLGISKCGKLKPLSEWGLNRLTSLSEFNIDGGYPELVSFPDNDNNCLMLPPTLTDLTIKELQNLESLSSLSHQNLPSLQYLYLLGCPKLCSLPKEDLLVTLVHLEIHNCPVLKQKCLKDKGDYWHHIAHIPFVKIYPEE